MRAEVQFPDQSECGIRLDSPAWWAWLETPSTRSFAYPLYDDQVGYIQGFLTVRKETRERGQHYWVAYHRTGRRLRKIYLGRAVQLTQQHLAATAERFLAMDRPAAQGGMGTDGQKEVMPGQHSGASLRREAMMRRVKCSHRAGTSWPTMDGAIWPAVVVHSRATIDSTQEPFFLENAARWATALREAAADVVMRERDAGHDDVMWRDEFPRMVAWAFGQRRHASGSDG
jgi:hypothetical protein